jgi:hypothetical protein
MTQEERITSLEARLAIAESRIAILESRLCFPTSPDRPWEGPFYGPVTCKAGTNIASKEK